jgi:hypothetical protein
MVYNKKAFSREVAYYKKELGKSLGRGKTCLVELPLGNEKAFFSIAPLSRAVHSLGSDMSVFVTGKRRRMLKTLDKTWALFEALEQGKKAKGTKELDAFIKTVEKKTKSKYFRKLFKRPDLYLVASRGCFRVEDKRSHSKKAASKRLDFKASWFRKRFWGELLQTASKILKQGYGIKKSERLGIGFELMPTAKDLKMPTDDYLGSFSIAYSFAMKARSFCKEVSMGANTSRKNQLDPLERISDLAATIVGCEYEKKINEPWFKAFKKLGPIIGSDKLKYSHAGFGIHGQGFGGKHFFGMKIGYPTPNKKSRWQSPGQMLLKPHWLEQTKIDPRPAKKRYAITDTLPLQNYIATCNIDFFKLRKRDEQIKKVMKKCVKLYAVGRKMPKGQTNLMLDTKHLYSGKSPILLSDIEVNPKVPHEAAKVFKIKNAGRYGNFPGGEVFVTPHRVDGTFVGDVVISVDKSYVIPKNNPLVISVKGGKYKVKSGSKKIVSALNKRKRDSWKMLAIFEKNKSMPKKLINNLRRNFNNLGEFAVNTNPKARLSRYLIETEKLANMMHIALGAGYEPGRETTYHCDIVINAPKQKIDLWGVGPKGKEHWIIKKGKFVV